MSKNKPKLLIDWCSFKAAKYACENWHYSKQPPCNKLAKLGVWENGKFIGAVIFGPGPSPNIWKTFGLKPSQGVELARVALANHKTEVSKIIAICIRIIKKQYPKIELIVSYADQEQNHAGTIYQAGNWIYLGEFGPKVIRAFRNGKIIHERNMRQRILDGKSRRSDFIDIPTKPKYKYIMPLTESMRELVFRMGKPYPKRQEHEINAL